MNTSKSKLRLEITVNPESMFAFLALIIFSFNNVKFYFLSME